MRRCIERKRDGAELAAGDWNGIIEGFMAGGIDEAQFAALCMACVLRGMTFDEAYALTGAMVQSGETVTFRAGPVVDKHSSGGVSDVVSLLAVPLAAACGARVAKLSGRALGHTGGTIDKLETIPGFNVALSLDAFVAQVEHIGCAIAAQSAALVPADKRIYALRDRTGTVPAMGLIASSILSKKIAGGADAFVFDVKAGSGSVLVHVDKARELARWLVEIARRFGRKAVAFVSDMDQPLGHCIGTGIEVLEARSLLCGARDERVRDLVVQIVEAMLEQAGIAGGAARAQAALENGSGYAKLLEMIAAQGGDVAAFEAMQLEANPLPIASPRSGFVQRIDAALLGNAARQLCARDPLGGIRVVSRAGDRVERGQVLLELFGPDKEQGAQLARAFTIGDEPAAPVPLIYERIAAAP